MRMLLRHAIMTIETPRVAWWAQSKQQSQKEHRNNRHLCCPLRHWWIQQRQVLLELKETIPKGNAPTEDHNQMHALWTAKRGFQRGPGFGCGCGNCSDGIATIIAILPIPTDVHTMPIPWSSLCRFHNCGATEVHTLAIPRSSPPWQFHDRCRANSTIVEQQRCALWQFHDH